MATPSFPPDAQRDPSGDTVTQFKISFMTCEVRAKSAVVQVPHLDEIVPPHDTIIGDVALGDTLTYPVSVFSDFRFERSA